jgi:hypothetical protein
MYIPFFVVDIWLMFVQASPLHHVQNKSGSSFSWQKSLASDVDWPPLNEILLTTEQEVDLMGVGGESDTLQHIPACCTQGQDESPYVTVSHHGMTAGLNRSESSDPVNGRRVSLSISRSDD